MNALIVVDCQNDFSDFGRIKVNGALSNSQRIFDFINSLNRDKWKIIFSKDYHPFNHISFKTFPSHCIKKTKGSEYMDILKDVQKDFEIKKGRHKKIENFSCFFKEKFTRKIKLDIFLKKNYISKVFICGLVKDICVMYTANDSVLQNYETFVINDLSISLNEKFYLENKNKDIKDINFKEVLEKYNE